MSDGDLLAIDPGPEESAFVIWRAGVIAHHGKVENHAFNRSLAKESCPVVIEMIASYGMAVGAEVFETCVWIGRFMETVSHRGVFDEADRLFRRDVKLHLCGNARAKDGEIRQRLIDIYSNGQGERAAKGLKKSPGPLYGFAKDKWQALALGVTYGELKLGWKIQ